MKKVSLALPVCIYKKCSHILGEIIKDGAISDANLRLLVDNIVISEQDGKLSINIDL